MCHNYSSNLQIVFVSPFEHHANLLPWREAGADVVWIAEDYSGKMDIVDLERKLQVHSYYITSHHPLVVLRTYKLLWKCHSPYTEVVAFCL